MKIDPGLKRQIKLMIQKSDEALKAATILTRAESFDAAASKAYYAVFHIMQAALLTRGLTFSKHAGVVGAFSRFFIKEGIFPEKFAAGIKQLRKDREIGDYEYGRAIGQSRATQNLEKAKEIVKMVKKELKQLSSSPKRPRREKV